MKQRTGPINIGIVGLGKIATDQHVPAIRASSLLALSSTADPVAGLPSVRQFGDIQSMLAADDVPDAVAICTPPQARYPLARLALDHGRHVLLEKPPCVTLAEVDDLKARAARSGLTLFCAWHSRFAPAVHPTMVWLASRACRRIRIEWREDVRVWHPNQKWIWQAGGFGAFDPGINALSIATRILPGPLITDAAALTFPANCAAPASVELSLHNAAGTDIRASFDFLKTGAPVWTIAIDTDDGNLLLSQGGERLSVDGVDVELDARGEYAALYAHFAALITAGESDADTAPLQIVADALLCGDRLAAPALDASYGGPD